MQKFKRDFEAGTAGREPAAGSTRRASTRAATSTRASRCCRSTCSVEDVRRLRRLELHDAAVVRGRTVRTSAAAARSSASPSSRSTSTSPTRSVRSRWRRPTAPCAPTSSGCSASSRRASARPPSSTIACRNILMAKLSGSGAAAKTITPMKSKRRPSAAEELSRGESLTTMLGKRSAKVAPADDTSSIEARRDAGGGEDADGGGDGATRTPW